jgi:hypothetical protein
MPDPSGAILRAVSTAGLPPLKSQAPISPLELKKKATCRWWLPDPGFLEIVLHVGLLDDGFQRHARADCEETPVSPPDAFAHCRRF